MNDKNIEIIVKSHPACPVNLKDFPNIGMTTSEESIEFLLSKCRVVYSSASTSAAVDAYCAGIPVISYRDQGALNLSPLRLFKDVQFVSKPNNLANLLNYLIASKSDKVSPKRFFKLDSNLHGWNKLLSID